MIVSPMPCGMCHVDTLENVLPVEKENATAKVQSVGETSSGILALELLLFLIKKGE